MKMRDMICVYEYMNIAYTYITLYINISTVLVKILHYIEVAHPTGPNESSVSILYVKQKEVRGTYETLIAKALNKFVEDGQITTDKYGNWVMDERVTHTVESIFPIIAQINRLTGGATGGKEALEERMLSSIFNYVGIPAREIGPVQQKQEAQRLDKEVQDLITQLKQYG